MTLFALGLYHVDFINLKSSEEEMKAINSDVTIDKLDSILTNLKVKEDPEEGLVFVEVPAEKMPSGQNLVLGRNRFIYFSAETCKQFFKIHYSHSTVHNLFQSLQLCLLFLMYFIISCTLQILRRSAVKAINLPHP